MPSDERTVPRHDPEERLPREIPISAGMDRPEPRPEPQAIEPIVQFFRYSHLAEHLQEISKPFGEMAHWIVATLPRNPERTVALRKLLEAKDAAVRARMAT